MSEIIGLSIRDAIGLPQLTGEQIRGTESWL